MSSVKCIIAHPDDEVIFMAPFLRSKKSIIKYSGCFPSPHSLIIKKVVCLTSKNNVQRKSEFKKICEYYGCEGSIYNIPIKRSIFSSNFRNTWSKISGELNSKCDICITHALYGDDHFHPQHILVSLFCLIQCLTRRKTIIFSHTSKSYASLVKSAITRTELTFKSLIFLGIKLTMIGLTKLFSKQYTTASADQIDLDKANDIYISQSLHYVNIIDNNFNFHILRPIFINRNKICEYKS